MTVHIIGAGMAGLLAGAMFRGEAQLYEAAPSLPNNHHALLRFRHDEIAQHLNIPFQAVEVMKIVKPFRNKVAEAIGYSMKSNGRASLRSIRSAEGKVDKRFIAPPDFIQQLQGCLAKPIQFNERLDREVMSHLFNGKETAFVSTMPMGQLMDILDYKEKPDFEFRHGWVVKAEVMIPSDMCATIYYPDPSEPITRATLTGDLLQIELVEGFDQALWAIDRIMDVVLRDFGLTCSYSAELVRQKYAKISPIDDRERRKFIMWATDNFNIYSLGRFAVWKPGLLLDDVYHDVRKIQSMLRAGGCNYKARLK